MINDINYILSFLPSEVYKNKDVKHKLINVMSKLGQPINRGCPDCYNRAYFKLKRLKNNNYFTIDNTNNMTYKFRKDLHSYRSKKTGKVLTNDNSTAQERKEVYLQGKSYHSLFDLETIPTVKKAIKKAPVKVESSEASTPKKRTRKKKTSTN